MCVRACRAPRCIAQTGLHAGSGESLCSFWQACVCLWFGETESCREGWEVVGPSPVKLARVGRWPHRSQRAACRIWKLQRPSLFISRVDASTRAGRWGLPLQEGRRLAQLHGGPAQGCSCLCSEAKVKLARVPSSSTPSDVHLAPSPGTRAVPQPCPGDGPAAPFPRGRRVILSRLKTRRSRTVSCNSPSPSG